MSESTWVQSLRDPRWQKRRLEVLSAANFACSACERTDATLHVHHAYYRKGLKPWEYPDDALRCLCVDCHGDITAVLAELNELIGRLRDWWDVRRLIGYCRTVVELDSKNGFQPVAVRDYHDMVGIADAVRGRVADVEAALQADNTVNVRDLHARYTQPFYIMHAALEEAGRHGMDGLAMMRALLADVRA